MAYIEKRIIRAADGGTTTSWRARYRDPSGRERSQSFAKRSDAEDFLVGVEHDKRTGRYVDPHAGKKLLGAWLDQWEATTTHLRPSTRARDDAYLRNHVRPRFGDLPLSRISQLDVRTWVSELVAEGLAPATVQKNYQLLARSLSAAVDAGLIPLSPCRNISLPRVERTEMRFLTVPQVAELATAMDPRYRALVWLGAYGGLRAGEMFGLRARRFSEPHGRIEVAEILVEVKGELLFGPPKTRVGHRSIPLPRPVAERLAEHVRTYSRAGDELVFPAPEGGPVRLGLWRRRFWMPAIARTGFEGLRIHDLRHTAVSLWIAAGADVKEIARRAGHTSVAVVIDRYGHVMPDAAERVTTELEAMIEHPMQMR